MPTELEWRWCATCGQERAFEAPPCLDGHGPGCLDAACTSCGVVQTGWLPAEPPAAGRRPLGRAA